jgi:hypothetical protein
MHGKLAYASVCLQLYWTITTAHAVCCEVTQTRRGALAVEHVPVDVAPACKQSMLTVTHYGVSRETQQRALATSSAVVAAAGRCLNVLCFWIQSFPRPVLRDRLHR